MESTFGTRLRLQREEQRIPLATIAERTKIKLPLLEGLERDDVSRWPTGIFRRSYFRAYASAIGLEPEQVIGEFQALYPDPSTEEDITEAVAQARNIHLRRPPTRLRCLIDSAVNALPALHLQPSFKSAPSGIRTEWKPTVEEQLLVEAAPPKIPPNIQYSQETHDNSGVDFAAGAQLCTRLARH